MRPFLLNSLSLALVASTAWSPALAPDSRHQTAGILSRVNNAGPTSAKSLTLGIWNTASNITTYTIGNSWND